MCSYHARTFGDEGRCVRSPLAAEGTHPPLPRADLSTFGCAVAWLWVCLGSTPVDGPDGIPVIAHEHDPAFRRIIHPRRRVAYLRHADDRQLPRHHRHRKFGRAQDTRRLKTVGTRRRRVVRLPLRGAGEQRRPRHALQRPGGRRGRAGDEFRVPPAVRRSQHDQLRQRARAHPAPLSTPVDDVTSHSRSSCGATTHPSRPRRSSASTWRSGRGQADARTARLRTAARSDDARQRAGRQVLGRVVPGPRNTWPTTRPCRWCSSNAPSRTWASRSCAQPPPTPATPDLVRYAEETGYRRAWIYDTPPLQLDVWMTLALAAERTPARLCSCRATVTRSRHGVGDRPSRTSAGGGTDGVRVRHRLHSPPGSGRSGGPRSPSTSG